MKAIRILVQIMFFFNLLCIALVSPICTAKQAMVTIKDVTVQLIDTRPPIGETTIHEYKISAILYNTGDTKSVNISVKFREPQSGMVGNLTLFPQSYSLAPNEEKTFVIENWPTPLSGDIPLNISFKPSSPTVVLTEDNSGFYVYTLHIGNSTTKPSTPGFEVLILLIAILVLLGKKQLRK